MLECHYGSEPLDFRLLLLRMWKQAGRIVLFTILGTLFLGGGYYLKEVVLSPARYVATSLYQVEYVLDPATESEYTFINGSTWNQWMHTKEFLDLLYGNLEGTEEENIDREVMKGYLSASLQMDLRMPDTSVTTGDPGLSLRLAGAVEKSMVDFAAGQKGIDNIRVVDPAATVTSPSNARPWNACVLGAVVSCFLTVVILLIRELGQDSIWLPVTLWRRYGLKTLGTIESRDFGENAGWLLKERKSIGVLPVGLGSVPEEVLQALREALSQEGCRADLKEFSPGEKAAVIRGADGLVLAVKAGPHMGRRLEGTLDHLRTQDCPVTAAVLVQADEQMIRRYYWELPGTGKSGETGRDSGTGDVSHAGEVSGTRRAKG